MKEFDKVMKILYKMHDYQQMKNIKGECITNTQYLYDVVKHNTNLQVKAIAVFVLYDNRICLGHIMLEVDGKLIDPSYEYSSLVGAQYCNSYNVAKKLVMAKNGYVDDWKLMLESHLNFRKKAEKINNGGLLIITEKYYHSQADYCEGKPQSPPRCLGISLK